MNITSSMSQLVSTGADAFDNLFEVTFDFQGLQDDIISGLQENDILSQNLTIRTSNFNPPVPKRNEINLPYKSYTIKKPGSAIDVPQKMTFNIRIDKHYDILRALKIIEGKSFKAEESAKYANKLGEGFLITVKAYTNPDPANVKEQGSETLDVLRSLDGERKWVFKNVHIMSISTNEYGHDDKPDPVHAQVELIYGSYEEEFKEKTSSGSQASPNLTPRETPPNLPRTYDLDYYGRFSRQAYAKAREEAALAEFEKRQLLKPKPQPLPFQTER